MYLFYNKETTTASIKAATSSKHYIIWGTSEGNCGTISEYPERASWIGKDAVRIPWSLVLQAVDIIIENNLHKEEHHA